MVDLLDIFLDVEVLLILHDRYGISTEAVKDNTKSHMK